MSDVKDRNVIMAEDFVHLTSILQVQVYALISYCERHETSYGF